MHSGALGQGQVWSLVLLVASLLAMAWMLIREKNASAEQDQLPRSMVVFTVVAGGALVFALLHLSNPLLMVLALIGGAVAGQ